MSGVGEGPRYQLSVNMCMRSQFTLLTAWTSLHLPNAFHVHTLPSHPIRTTWPSPCPWAHLRIALAAASAPSQAQLEAASSGRRRSPSRTRGGGARPWVSRARNLGARRRRLGADGVGWGGKSAQADIAAMPAPMGGPWAPTRASSIELVAPKPRFAIRGKPTVHNTTKL